MSWRNLYLYWLSRRTPGHLPTRKDFDPPLEIPQVLPWMLMIDVVDGGFRNRLMGSELTARMARDDTGKMIEAGAIPELALTQFLGLLEKVVATGAPVLFAIGTARQSEAPLVGLLLPLHGPSGSVEKIMGGIFFDKNEVFTEGSWNHDVLTEIPIPGDLTA